jgi:hypothetical protein
MWPFSTFSMAHQAPALVSFTVVHRQANLRCLKFCRQAAQASNEDTKSSRSLHQSFKAGDNGRRKDVKVTTRVCLTVVGFFRFIQLHVVFRYSAITKFF